ncbi:MAG TPA: hypothetical protein DCE41_23070 [Cytophagales bacterium]|nr:hypothetical protein [Cytophagales bacterium]HAA23192.1 hypothetical protein [Cytophagales bacterium]HAP59312.1 hypothetical protein [Cytophagales bacterium]
MELKFNLYNLLIGFGMLQGFIFSGVLLARSSWKQANKYLGISVLFLSFYLFWVLKYDFGFQKQWIKLQFLPVLFLWGIGPALYAYLRFFFRAPLSRNQLRWHFLPLLLEQITFNSLTLLFWVHGWEGESLPRWGRVFAWNIFNVEHVVAMVSMGIYTGIIIRYLRKYPENKLPLRLRGLLWCFLLLYVVWVPYTYMDVVYYNLGFPPSGFYLFYLVFAGLTYGIGFLGFRLRQDPTPTAVPEKSKAPTTVTNQMVQLAEELALRMETDQWYLDPELTVRSVAEKMAIPANQLSAAINGVRRESFRDFVNGYRVEAFKAQVSAGAHQQETLLGIALGCGFNSKASFNRIFKKQTELTPAEYVRRVKE